MEKEKFETMQFWISRFETQDVIVTSGEGNGGSSNPSGNYEGGVWGQDDLNDPFGS